jgi:hypothetical protein
MNTDLLKVGMGKKFYHFIVIALSELYKLRASHSGRVVEGMNCLRPLEHLGHGFQFHPRH